jgi:hypothetical protein
MRSGPIPGGRCHGALGRSTPGGPEAGHKGNSHMLMMDKDNLQIADLIIGWLGETWPCSRPRLVSRDGPGLPSVLEIRWLKRKMPNSRWLAPSHGENRGESPRERQRFQSFSLDALFI